MRLCITQLKYGAPCKQQRPQAHLGGSWRGLPGCWSCRCGRASSHWCLRFRPHARYPCRSLTATATAGAACLRPGCARYQAPHGPRRAASVLAACSWTSPHGAGRRCGRPAAMNRRPFSCKTRSALSTDWLARSCPACANLLLGANRRPAGATSGATPNVRCKPLQPAQVKERVDAQPTASLLHRFACLLRCKKSG